MEKTLHNRFMLLLIGLAFCVSCRAEERAEPVDGVHFSILRLQQQHFPDITFTLAVTDASGLVLGLRDSDFRLYDDGFRMIAGEPRESAGSGQLATTGVFTWTPVRQGYEFSYRVSEPKGNNAVHNLKVELAYMNQLHQADFKYREADGLQEVVPPPRPLKREDIYLYGGASAVTLLLLFLVIVVISRRRRQRFRQGKTCARCGEPLPLASNECMYCGFQPQGKYAKRTQERITKREATPGATETDAPAEGVEAVEKKRRQERINGNAENERKFSSTDSIRVVNEYRESDSQRSSREVTPILRKIYFIKVATGAHAGRIYLINPDQITLIGSSRKADVMLPDQAVRPVHAKLKRVDNEFWLSSMGEFSDLVVEDEFIRQTRMICGGTEVKLGDTTIVLDMRLERINQ
ncbi:hypothetical protein JW905_10885 [bacterium]|nr:hypothetical protein [candidate division CSSED10-310 bacterium]